MLDMVLNRVIVRFLAVSVLIVAAGDRLVTGRSQEQSTAGSTPVLSRGVYTAEQVARGESTYLGECARCHALELHGGDFGPALLGTAFIDEWTGKTVGDLFRVVILTMPLDNPNSLSPKEGVDVVAYLLERNGFPTGDTELTPESAVLNSITIPSGPSP